MALPSPASPSPPPPASGLIVFVVESGPNGDDVKNLWTVRPNGEDAAAITRVTDEAYGNPVFTADGQRILADYSAGGPGMIVSMDRAGGDLRVVVDPRASVGEPAMSLDGQWIAWSESDGGRAAIVVAHPDGSNRHQVVDPGINPDYADVGARFPAFAPDGLSLAVTIDEIVHVVRLDGSDDHVISPPGATCEQGRWAHDGSHVVTSCDGRLLVLSLDGSVPVDVGVGHEPSFSPDDRWIVYQRWLPGTTHIGLVVAPADGSSPVEIWKTPEGEDVFVVEPAWGP